MRRWLSLYALSITSIVILAFLIPLAVLIRDLSADRAMSGAEREAQTVARFASTIDGGPDSVAVLTATLAASPSTLVRLSDGTVIGADLPAGVDFTAAVERGQAYQQRLADGRAAIVPVLRGSEEPWVVVVAVSDSDLFQNVAASWTVLGFLGLILIGLALIVADRMGRAVVSPINDLVDATHRLGRGELTVEVQPGGPSELAEVGSAFNTLTGRVRSLLRRERESAADLSHRLRTPLTALRLDIDALRRQVDVSRLERDVDTLERAVSRVISEARRSVRDGADATADLTVVVRQRAAFWGSLAEDQGRSWELEVEPGSLMVAGNESDLEAMLDALLGNIFAHTPVDTGYRIRLRSLGDARAELVVGDDGPGIFDDSLLERGTSGGESTGLGVDIVRSTAEAGGGEAAWEVGESSGTVVRVVLPLVEPAG